MVIDGFGAVPDDIAVLVTVGTAGMFTLDIVVAVVVTDGFGAAPDDIAVLVTVGTAGMFTLDVVVAVVVTNGFGALWLADDTETIFPLVVVGAVMVTVCIEAVFGAATVTVCFGTVFTDNDTRLLQIQGQKLLVPWLLEAGKQQL